MTTRRQFLATSSTGAMALGLGVHPFSALTSREWSQPATFWLHDPMPEDSFVSLAKVAIQAAQEAGAQYSDICLGEIYGLNMEIGKQETEPNLAVAARRGYCIRTLVNGIWGVISGVMLKQDTLIQAAHTAARHALNQSKALQTVGWQAIRLAEASVESGDWQGPMEIDPFTVPLQEQREQLGAHCFAIQRVLGAEGYSRVWWQQQTRIFVSSEGVTQRQRRVWGNKEIGIGNLALPGYGIHLGGFETLYDPGLLERAKRFAEEVKRMGTFPIVPLETGRYQVVMHSEVAARVVRALTQACEGDRILGLEADGRGGSFLPSYEEMMTGSGQLFSPAITLESSASGTAATSWCWDCEGIENRPYSLIRDGRVVGYTVNRDHASHISGEFPLNGGYTGLEPGDRPSTVAPEVTLQPSPSQLSLDDLLADMDNGILMWPGLVSFNPSPNLETASLRCPMYRVRKGKIDGVLPMGLALLRTQKLWKENFEAVGDTTTSYPNLMIDAKSVGGAGYYQIINTPAIRFKDIDVVSLARDISTAGVKTHGQ